VLVGPEGSATGLPLHINNRCRLLHVAAARI
jgi:hypothetical protein